MDEKNEKPISSTKSLFWDAINTEDKDYLCKTIYNCCYHGSFKHKLLAGLVVDGASVLSGCIACSEIPQDAFQTGLCAISIVELCVCCTLVLECVTNERVGLEMLRAVQKFVADNKQTLFKNLSSIFDDPLNTLDANTHRELEKWLQDSCDQYFKLFPDPLDFAEHKTQFKARQNAKK